LGDRVHHRAQGLLLMPMTFIPNPAGLLRLLQSPTGSVGRWVARKTVEVSEAAQRLAPVSTGELRSSIYPVVHAGPLRGEVIAGAPYSLFVHEGTRPHTIEPNQANVLRFPSKAGEIVFARQVDHPGTRSRPFLSDALALVIVT
jgi:hypothetical protein